MGVFQIIAVSRQVVLPCLVIPVSVIRMPAACLDVLQLAKLHVHDSQPSATAISYQPDTWQVFVSISSAGAHLSALHIRHLRDGSDIQRQRSCRPLRTRSFPCSCDSPVEKWF